MTALEQQLLSALMTLSEQFESEQRQQAKLIQTLLEQVQQLSKKIDAWSR